jgi:hypothetical protein
MRAQSLDDLEPSGRFDSGTVEEAEVRTLGVDLAAGSATTAACIITWHNGHAVVGQPIRPLDDTQLLGLFDGLRPGDRAGVDCPFGWPTDFVTAVTAHASGQPWPGRGEDSTAYRTRLRLRMTDRRVAQMTRRPPLSVAFDKLGATAARWAHLADALAASGTRVDRTGAGLVAEVYPAAARLRWNLSPSRSVAELQMALPSLQFADASGAVAYEGNEHAFDALVAALVARAVALELTERPRPTDLSVAAVEGWIHIPCRGSLAALADLGGQAPSA